MQHASTSPFYPLFASLDVGAQMMKGRSGEVPGMTRSGLESNCARDWRPPRIRGEGNPSRTPLVLRAFVPHRVAIPDVSREGAVHNVAWETSAPI